MNLTTLFRLRKPEGTDPVDVKDFNDNFDVIDAEIGKRLEKTGNGSDLVMAFSQAGSRANLTSGEKIAVSFGKVMKWFADLKTVAFTGSYGDLANKPSIPGGAAASQGVANNCTTTAAGYVLDARQGKTLMDKANQISSDLSGGLNGCKVSYEGGSFYAAYGGVKKKLGNCAYSLPAMHIQIQDTSAGASPSQIYLPLQGASNVSFRFTKQNYGRPTAAINYVDGTVQQVFSLDRGVFDKTYSISLPKEAANIYFDLVNDSTCTDYRIYNFSVI